MGKTKVSKALADLVTLTKTTGERIGDYMPERKKLNLRRQSYIYRDGIKMVYDYQLKNYVEHVDNNKLEVK